MFSLLTHHIRKYFGFSRGQTYGVVVLLLFLAVALTIPTIIHYYDICERRKDALESAGVLDALVEGLQEANMSGRDYVASGANVKKVFFDINTACEDDLKRLYGIGPIRAKRIIAYRHRLGGFVNTMQYSEIYNLPADVVGRLQKHTFVKPHFVPERIAINNASVQRLAHHPYLTYSQAKAIIAYKEQYGAFGEARDVAKVKCIDVSVMEKLLPYLIVPN